MGNGNRTCTMHSLNKIHVVSSTRLAVSGSKGLVSRTVTGPVLTSHKVSDACVVGLAGVVSCRSLSSESHV